MGGAMSAVAPPRVFRKDVTCTICGVLTRVSQEGHLIKTEGFRCEECRRSRYDCPVCMDSGRVLNYDRAMEKDEAGPGTPWVFDPCPRCQKEVSHETP
jgi:hypothetical protein